MTWRRHTTPTGVPVYQDEDAWRIEAELRLSTHVGMVFGQYASEAGREASIEGWRLYRPDGKRTGPTYRRLVDAKAAAEARKAVA